MKNQHVAVNRPQLITLKYVAAIACISLLALPVGLDAQQAPPTTVKIPDGMIVRVTLTEDLNSGKDHQNDEVYGVIAEDVKVDGVVAIAKGAAVVGHITQAEPKGRWGHGGTLAYTLDYAQAVDGSNVRLRASSDQGGQDSKGAFMMGLSGAFIHGKNINVPKGTQMNAYIDGDHTVTIKSEAH